LKTEKREISDTNPLTETGHLKPEHSRSSKKQSIRNILPFITWEGVYATIFITLTGNPFITGFALFLGANDFEIGLLAAIPFLTQISQLLAALKIDISGRCRNLTTYSLLTARQIWWLLLPLPLISIPWRMPYLFGAFTASSVGAAMGAAGWFTWIANLIPGRIRGRYLGFRSTAVSLSTIITFLAGGAILDFFKRNGEIDFGFSILIGIAGISGIAAAMAIKKFPEMKSIPSVIRPNIEYFLEPFRNPVFKKLMVIFFVWNLGTGVASAFFAAHMLINLKMSFTQVSIYSAASLIAAVISNRSWGKLIDRYGSRPIIIVCTLGLSIVPLIWLFPRPGFIWILWIETIYAGILWAGFNLAALNLPIAISPPKNRTIYLATFTVISGIGFFTASLIGGLLAQIWKPLSYSIGPQLIVNYHLLFIISSLVRGTAAAMTWDIKEPSRGTSPMPPGFLRIISYIGRAGSIKL